MAGEIVVEKREIVVGEERERGASRRGGVRIAGKEVPARGVLTVLSTEWLRVGPRGFVLGRARSG